MNTQTLKPLRHFIIETFGNGKALDAKAVLEQAAPSYPGEKYCSVPSIAEHLKALKAVGILHEDGSYLDDKGKLVSMYRISEYGLEKIEKK
ncbi:MAG TPA: hypothetical protein DCS48_10680 [Desulfovibrio sp.]|nr:hypothetical protein [Desulfovibrio sp.]